MLAPDGGSPILATDNRVGFHNIVKETFMALQTQLGRPRGGRILILMAVACGLGMPASAPGQSARSSRGAMQRFRAMQEAQRKQSITTLQARLTTAQQSLTHAESELTAAEGPRKAAESQHRVAETQLKQEKRKLAELVHQQRDVEDKLVSELPADSPVGQAHKALRRAEEALHAHRHRVLNLPADSPENLTAHLDYEYQHLSPEQRDRLKADASTARADEEVSAKKSAARKLQHVYFETKPEWKKAEAARVAQVETIKSLTADEKNLHSELTRQTARLHAAQQEQRAAQQVIMTTSTQLTALGARPAVKSN